MRIAVDLMGSDSAIQVLYKGVEDAVAKLSSKAVVSLIGTEDAFQLLPQNSLPKFVAEETITMTDSPLYSARRKQNSSLMIGLRLLKEKKIDAFVTAGNTGALIAGASISLPRIDSIERPALLTLIPTKKKPMVTIDVGGNVFSSAKQLVQFAFMGSAYQTFCNGIDNPRVGLLNIGIESMKGTDELRDAYRMLSEISTPHFSFVGNVEGREVFQGDIDVLVTDGFVGNVFLKTAEGMSLFILEAIQASLEVPQSLLEAFSYEEYPGALLCGVDGVVVKSHGKPSSETITKSILLSASLIEKEFVSKVTQISWE